jgi:hypothetical protein
MNQIGESASHTRSLLNVVSTFTSPFLRILILWIVIVIVVVIDRRVV